MQTKEQVREYARLWARRKAVKHRGLGLCHDCNNPVIPGKNYCEKCISRFSGRDHSAYMKIRAEVRKEFGVCQKCDNMSESGHVLCSQCAARDRKRSKILKKKLIETRKAKGQCRSCDSPATPGYATCEYHRLLAKKRDQDWKRRQSRS